MRAPTYGLLCMIAGVAAVTMLQIGKLLFQPSSLVVLAVSFGNGLLCGAFITLAGRRVR